jgi:hypothetical protein
MRESLTEFRDSGLWFSSLARRRPTFTDILATPTRHFGAASRRANSSGRQDAVKKIDTALRTPLERRAA